MPLLSPDNAQISLTDLTLKTKHSVTTVEHFFHLQPGQEYFFEFYGALIELEQSLALFYADELADSASKQQQQYWQAILNQLNRCRATADQFIEHAHPVDLKKPSSKRLRYYQRVFAFLFNVFYEIRTPIGMLLTYWHLLTRSLELPQAPTVNGVSGSLATLSDFVQNASDHLQNIEARFHNDDAFLSGGNGT